VGPLDAVLVSVPSRATLSLAYLSFLLLKYSTDWAIEWFYADLSHEFRDALLRGNIVTSHRNKPGSNRGFPARVRTPARHGRGGKGYAEADSSVGKHL
jgi:hypothetical protein